MTRNEVVSAIFDTITHACTRGYAMNCDVEDVFTIMGKLAPEPKAKPEVPWYDPKKVKRVGTLVERSQFTDDQREAALVALRAVGLL